MSHACCSCSTTNTAVLELIQSSDHDPATPRCIHMDNTVQLSYDMNHSTCVTDTGHHRYSSMYRYTPPKDQQWRICC